MIVGRPGGVNCNLSYFYGRKYGADKEAFFRTADIFVFPTYYHNECFPLVLLEAMQHGVPCISTCEGGVPDIIEDGKTGYIVERRRPEQLVAKMERILNDRVLRESMGRAGRCKFEQEFTLRTFEERICEVLGNLV